MQCSGCGKSIPFGGSVCPYCHRDKSQDQRYTVAAIVIGGAGAYIGWRVGGFWWAVGGFMLGGLAAALATGVGRQTKAPEVRVVEQAGAVPDDVAARLRKLQDLQAQGLISADEAAERRRQVLGEV